MSKHWIHIGLTGLLLICLVIGVTSGLAGQDKASSGKKANKRMTVTFNELPAATGFGDVDVKAVNYLILQALKKHNVKAAGFVVGENIGSEFDLLGEWLNDGHVLGNMTYANQDLNDLGIEQFIADINLGAETIEPMLSGFGQKNRYFRYPYLHYGTTVEAKEEVTRYIDHMKYIVAHASIVPEDYVYNMTLQKLGKVPDSAAFVTLLNEYINHVLDEVEREEALAKELVGRPVKQILLLRANRLNAVYLDDLLTALEDMGYSFITLDEALNDDVYHETEAYFGPKGVGYLDMIYQSNADLLPAE